MHRRTTLIRTQRAIVAIVALSVALALAHPAGADAERRFRGRYVFTHTDAFASGRATFRPAIELPDGRILTLDPPGSGLPRITPGSVIEVEAVPDGGTLEVTEGGTEVVADAPPDAAAAAVQRDVAVLLINFSNDRTQPYTVEHARGVGFTNADSVASYYGEASYGGLSLAGDVFGWYEIADDNAGCDVNGWASAAMTAAEDEGVSLAPYEHVVVAFPAASSCAWAGLAYLPGRYSWLNGPSAMGLRVFAHELGHNLGTHHASTLECSSDGTRVSLVADVATCGSNEYGDPFTVMGSSSRLHPTAFSRENLGWLTGSSVRTVIGSGDHTLAPLGASGGVRTIRIPRNGSTFLSLEFRQPSGTQFETFLPTSPVATGVSVRVVPSAWSSTRSYLVDTTPSTSTFADAPLASGASLVDPLTGVEVETLSVGTDGATVRITFPGDTVRPSPPTHLRIERAGREIALRWHESTDDVGVEGYRIFRNGRLVGQVSRLRFGETLRRRGTRPTYEVRAYDAAGNVSRPARSRA